MAAQGSDTDFAYGYDAAGNLTQLTHDNQSKTITANALNQAGSVNQTQYVYDANGNLLEDSKRIYTWDAANRLLSITNKTTGHVTTFAYDGFSRRISRTESDISGSDIVTYNIWCGMRICEQHLADGTVVARYYKQGELHTGTAYYYAQDQVGSVVAMVDANGQVAGRTTYGPYGQIIAQSGVQPNYAYAGLYRHQVSGLYLATYRAYDPTTARWIKRDPIKEAGGLNIYAYVMGNPVTFSDVNGLVFGIPAGESYGAEAAQYWANKQIQTGNVWYAVPGVLASLWTPCTSDATANTLLSVGGIGSLALNQLRAAEILSVIGLYGSVSTALVKPTDVNIAKAILAVVTMGVSGSIVNSGYGAVGRGVAVFVEAQAAIVSTFTGEH